jgi:hypothetical protein
MPSPPRKGRALLGGFAVLPAVYNKKEKSSPYESFMDAYVEWRSELKVSPGNKLSDTHLPFHAVLNIAYLYGCMKNIDFRMCSFLGEEREGVSEKRHVFVS